MRSKITIPHLWDQARTVISAGLGATLAGVLVVGWSSVSGADEAGDTEELRNNSPFIPEDFVDPDDRRSPKPEPEPEPEPRDDPLDDLQLRGITVVGDEELFSLHDPSSEESFWLAVDQSEGDYTLLAFDDSAESVTVGRGDRERSIVLNEAEIEALSEDELERRQQEESERRERMMEQAGVTSADETDRAGGPPSEDSQVDATRPDGPTEAADEGQPDAEETDERLRQAAEELRQRRALRGSGGEED